MIRINIMRLLCLILLISLPLSEVQAQKKVTQPHLDKSSDDTTGTINFVLVETLKTHGKIIDVACSSDGRHFAAVDEHANLNVWNNEKSERIFSMNACPSEKASIEFSENSSWLAYVTLCRSSASSDVRDAKLTLIDIGNRKLFKQYSLESTRGAVSLDFLPDGKTIAIAGLQQRTAQWMNSVEFWSIESGFHESISFGKAGGREGGIVDIRHCNDGKKMVLVQKYDYQKKSVKERIAQTLAPGGLLADSIISIGEKEQKKISWSKKFTVNMQKLPALARTFNTKPMSPAVDLNRDHSLLAVGLHDGQIYVYRFPSMQLIGTTSTEQSHYDLSLCFEGKSELLVAHGAKLSCYSIGKHIALSRTRNVQSSITAIDADRQGNLITGHRNGNVAIWKIKQSDQ